MGDSDTNNEISSRELLKAMLEKGENEFFPKFSRYLEKFINIFNHSMVQHRIITHLDEFDKNLNNISSAESVYNILYSFKKFLYYMKNESPPVKMFKKLQQSGFFALVNEEQFNFLNENLTTEEGAIKFLELIDKKMPEEERQEKQEFEKYIKSWSENQLRLRGKSYSFIKDEVSKIRNEKLEAEKHVKGVIEILINDVVKYFEPLREKLVFHGINASTMRNVALPFSLVSMVGSEIFPDSSFHKYEIRTRPGWFDNVIKFVTSYLKNEKSEEDMQNYLKKHHLEDNFEDFQNRTQVWLNAIRSKNYRPSSLLISNEVAKNEIERMKKFIYAVVLNDTDLIKNHTESTQKMVNAAIHTPNDRLTGYLPFLSFGQLPLPNASGSRIVRLTFVLRSNMSRTNANNILSELSKIFTSLNHITIEANDSTFLLHADMNVDENLTVLVARSIAKLSELSISAVLIGSYGLSGFRHAMYPEFNRIYGNGNAEGFITTNSWPSGALIYGNEPYFCPTGWRRYSINVGKTAQEFREAYGDWPVAYHGTAGLLSACMLQQGLRASGEGCFLNNGVGRIYLSPSIEYCGHPRYAEIWKVRGKYVQMVLQVRVKKRLIFDKKPGTLGGAFPLDIPMDSNFKDNDTLEWIIKWPPGEFLDSLNGIVIYGLMLRVSDKHPGSLPQCAWWEEQFKQST